MKTENNFVARSHSNSYVPQLTNLTPMFNRKIIFGLALLVLILLAGRASVKSGVFAAATPRQVKHVLLISAEGLHALDFANFIKSNPQSNLARLSAQGVTYTQASTSKPSDSFPGLMSIVTGGSPISTALWYEGAYARDLSPAGSDCKTTGTEIVWDSGIDRDKKLVDGGGIDPARLPLDPKKGCSPVCPHDYLRVNTIFEVVHQANMRTAWVDKHPSYEMTNGPPGMGVEDLFTPELPASGASRSVKAAEILDDMKINAVLNEINGKDHTGTKDQPTPNPFGTSLQAFSMGQKLGGYTDEIGSPSEILSENADTRGQFHRKVAEV